MTAAGRLPQFQSERFSARFLGVRARTWSTKAQTLRAARTECTCSHGAHSSRMLLGGAVALQVISASLIGKLTTRVTTAADNIATVPVAANQNCAPCGLNRSDQTQNRPPSTAANVMGTSSGLK
jgi:hypothetical protein